MNTYRSFCLCFIVSCSAGVHAAEAESFLKPFSEEYQTVFFAVLEGAYRDGLSDEHLAILLARNEPASYENFIYACPLCTPTVAALEAYRSRPDRLYSLKNGSSTFGFGILPDLAFLLEAEDKSNRLLGIQLLLRRWIAAHLDSRNFDPATLERWKKRIEVAAREGRRILENYRETGSAHLTAPALAEEGACAVCSGSEQGAMSVVGSPVSGPELPRFER